MTGLLWRAGGSLALGVLGLALIFWQLEHASLSRAAGQGRPSAAVYGLLFVGLILLYVAMATALRRWVRYLREHPGTPQLPPWFLVTLMVVASALLIGGIAVHANWVAVQDPTPTEISEGFIAYEVSFAALVLVPLVLLVARRVRR